MAEIVAESLICTVCGADIRSGSLFCYNCGGTVSSTPVDEDIASANEVPDAGAAKIQSIDQPQNGNLEKLKSAASLRKRSKVFNRAPAEYTWEKRTGPSPAFVIAAISLTVFTAILLFLAFYLR